MPPEQTPPPQPEPFNFFETNPKKNFAPWFIKLIVVLIAVGLGATGALWQFAYNNYQYGLSALESSEEQILAIKQQRAENPTANWQTYYNEKYGFEVKYPNDWRESANGSFTFSNSKNQEFSVGMIGTGTEEEVFASVGFVRNGSALLFMDSITNEPVAVVEKMINGNKVFYANALARIYSVNGYKGVAEGFTALIENNDRSAVINAAAISENEFNQILSTFKFIK